MARYGSKLNADDLNKVLEIIAKENPNFHFSNEEVDLDMDTLVFIRLII
jgi:DNA invertase Pin-like site-specific DNA recombinase